MNSPYSEMIVKAIANVARRIDSLTVRSGYNWRNPSPDLADRISFSVTHMRVVNICVTTNLSNREKYLSFWQNLLKRGVYARWMQAVDCYSLPTTCKDGDLLVLVCTQSEYSRFLTGGESRRPYNVLVFTDQTFEDHRVLHVIREWVQTNLC